MPGRIGFASTLFPPGGAISKIRQNRSESHRPQHWTITGAPARTLWRSWNGERLSANLLNSPFPSLSCIGGSAVPIRRNSTQSLSSTSAYSGPNTPPAWSTAQSPNVLLTTGSLPVTSLIFCACPISIPNLPNHSCPSSSYTGATVTKRRPPGTANLSSM